MVKIQPQETDVQHLPPFAPAVPLIFGLDGSQIDARTLEAHRVRYKTML